MAVDTNTTETLVTQGLYWLNQAGGPGLAAIAVVAYRWISAGAKALYALALRIADSNDAVVAGQKELVAKMDELIEHMKKP